MNTKSLNKQLEKLFFEEVDRDFIDFANSIIPHHPVPINLAEYANAYLTHMDNAMILMSGYKADQWQDFADMCQAMKEQEIENGRWNGLSSDVVAAADLIAHRVFDGILETEAEVENPEHLQLVVGLYCYAVVACNDCFKVKDFRKLFVAAWFIYYSTVLGVEHNATPGQSSFLS